MVLALGFLVGVVIFGTLIDEINQLGKIDRNEESAGKQDKEHGQSRVGPVTDNIQTASCCVR